MEIEIGAVYRTEVAVWTVLYISPNGGMVHVRREDGHDAWFCREYLMSACIERIA